MEDDMKQEEQIHASDENDDETSSSSEDDLLSDEGEDDALVLKMEAAIQENPYSFNDYVEYIRALRKNGMLEKLREARTAMSAIFPLSPRMWQEWTQDEARLMSSQAEVTAVESLFERGLQDYVSVPLWLDYLEFIRLHDQDVVENNAAGITKMRSLFERALASASLHFAEASKIWDAYLQYEMNLLSNVQETGEARTKEVNCVRSIYRRKLSVPLCDMATTLRDYINWESNQGVKIGDDLEELAGLPVNVATAYKKAVEMCSLREPLEEKVCKGKANDAESLRHFLSYIALEEGLGDPTRVQVLYERAVVEFPITHDLWLKYTGYLEQNLKVSSVILSVYGRAVRNCPWNQALWGRYLLALERANSSEADSAKVFEQSLQSGFAFSSPEEYLDHYLIRVDGLRRRICCLPDDTKKSPYLGTLRDTFNQAVQFLSTYFPSFVDHTARLHSYWARLETSLANDLVAARGVWESLIKSSGWMVEAWRGYISMEFNLGNLAEARTLYKRCYSRRLEGNGTEVLCDAWLQFEREYGSLEDYDRAFTKVTPRLAEVKQLQQQQQQQEAKSAATVARQTHVKKEVSLGQKKRPFVQDSDFPKQKPKKQPKLSSVKNVREAGQEISDGAQTIRTAQTEKAAQNAYAAHEEPAVQARASTASSWFTDQCTVFVSRLTPEVTEDDLHRLFSNCNGLKEIRLMKDRNTGKSRGFAYIDFENEDGLLAALKLDNTKWKGHKLRVLRSDPSLGGKKGGKQCAGWQGNSSDGSKVQNLKENPDYIQAENVEGQTGKGAQGGDTRDTNERPPSGSSPRGRGRGGRFNANVVSHRRGAHVQLTGKNTFAVPRSLARPLGFSEHQPKEVPQEELKSNEDFRKMLSKD